MSTQTKFYKALDDNGNVVCTGNLTKISEFTGTKYNAVLQACKRNGKSGGYKIELFEHQLCLDCGMVISNFNRYEHKVINFCKFCYKAKCRSEWADKKDFVNEVRRYNRKKPKETKRCPICTEDFQTAKKVQMICSKESCQKKYKQILDRRYREKRRKND